MSEHDDTSPDPRDGIHLRPGSSVQVNGRRVTDSEPEDFTEDDARAAARAARRR